MTKEQFKQLFLNLTEYTIPFGEESKLEKYLPSGYKKDSVGNYYYQIGNSETLFTSHLDTFSTEYEKINQIIDKDDPYKISTDETTILGGDNKLGCAILIGMIENNIPGTYYFFIGEEPLDSGGIYGSKNALKSNPEFFKKFKRCIAFDRRKYGSIVIRQMGRMCCSMDFAKKIAEEFDIRGIKWDQEGGFGYYTDTAVFMDIIPECTNLSAGGFNEHYKNEWVDLNYTYEVYKTALDVNWESLPTVRELEVRFSEEDSKSNKIFKYDLFLQKQTLKKIFNLFKSVELRNTRNVLKDGVRHLTFSKWLEDYDLDVYLKGNKIIIDNKKLSIDDLKNYILKEFKDDIIENINYYIDEYKNGDEESIELIIEILSIFDEKVSKKEALKYADKFIKKLKRI